MHFTTRTSNSCSRNEPQCARLTSEEEKSSPEDSTTNRLQTTSSLRRQRITHQPENTSRDLRGRLLVALVDGDVLVELGNLLCEGRCIGLGFLDRRSELLDEAVCLLDRTLLFNRCVVAEPLLSFAAADKNNMMVE